MSKYDSFFERLSQRLLANGFAVKQTIRLDPYQLDVVAAKTGFETVYRTQQMTRFIIASAMETVDAKIVQDFSSRTIKFAIDNRHDINSLLPRGWGGNLLSVPVIVSDDFDDDLKKWISETLFKEHWTVLEISTFEFPVLISLKNRQIYYCKNIPTSGAAYYEWFQKFVEQQLNF